MVFMSCLSFSIRYDSLGSWKKAQSGRSAYSVRCGWPVLGLIGGLVSREWVTACKIRQYPRQV